MGNCYSARAWSHINGPVRYRSVTVGGLIIRDIRHLHNLNRCVDFRFCHIQRGYRVADTIFAMVNVNGSCTL